MITKTKIRPAQCCERVVASEEGNVVCPPTNGRVSKEMKKKRQLLIQK